MIHCLGSLSVFFLLITEFVLAEPLRAERPNIVIILADDLGVGDLSIYGATEIQTPSIDLLARQGVRALDAHSNCSVCTPSRYAILAGRPYWKDCVGDWNGKLVVDPQRITMAQHLKNQGYKTAYMGKWHLGWGKSDQGRSFRADINWNQTLPEGVLECGFDHYFGTPFSHNEPPYVLVRDREVIGVDSKDPIITVPPQEAKERKLKHWGWGSSIGGAKAHAARPVDQIDKMVTEEAVKFIHKNTNNPFYLHVALVAPHVPLEPHPQFRGKSKLGAYGDYILEMDFHVGTILNALKEKGLEENTIVIFSADNAAILHSEVFEKGHRSNLTFLGQKTDAWEGGHRVPLVIRWPGKIPAGETTNALIMLSDFYATISSLLGVPLPEAVIDSIDQSKVLLHPKTESIRKEAIYFGVFGFGLRQGNWVYYPKQGSQGLTTMENVTYGMDLLHQKIRHSDYDFNGKIKKEAPLDQLYDLTRLGGQNQNLSQSDPERAKQMKKRLEAILGKQK